MLPLREDTATTITFGTAVDATDGFTPETGLDLSTADSAVLIKHGSSTVVDISSETATAVSGSDGEYSLPLTASHTDTAGRLTLIVIDTSLMRPIRLEFVVLPTNVFDSLYGTDKLEVDINQIGGSATSLANLKEGTLSLVTGAVDTGSTTTSIVTDLTEATNSHYNGRTITFNSGALAGQSSEITGYNGASKTLTVSALTEAPAAADTFTIS